MGHVVRRAPTPQQWRLGIALELKRRFPPAPSARTACPTVRTAVLTKPCFISVRKKLTSPRYPNLHLPDSTISQDSYSSYIMVHKYFVLKNPDNIESSLAAPMFCAVITMYSPLVGTKIGPGKKVVVIGIYMPLLPTSRLNLYDNRGRLAAVWNNLELYGQPLLEARRILSLTALIRDRMRFL